MNVLIVGAGFVGSGLYDSFVNSFSKASVFLKSREGILPEVEFDLIVDATSQSSKNECREVAKELNLLLEIYPRSKLIVLQSYSTLQGKLKSSDEINFGVNIQISTPYSSVKYFKERYLLSTCQNVERIRFMYLPVITGAGGVWDKHSKNLKEASRSIIIPRVLVHYVNIDYICIELLRQYEEDSKRTAISQGKILLSEVLSLEKFEFNKYLRNYLYEKTSFVVLKLLVHLPLIANGVFFIAEKLFGQFIIYFPSVFYWHLFKVQDGMDFDI